MRKKKHETRIFFTSDLWLYRYNILDLYNRNFKDMDEMVHTISENWNTTVDDNDIVFILGNFIYDSTKYQNILNELKGNIFFIPTEMDKNVLQTDMNFVNMLMIYGTSNFFNRLNMTDDSDEDKISTYLDSCENFGLATGDQTLLSLSNKVDNGIGDFIIVKNSIFEMPKYGIVLSTYPLMDWNGKDNGVINIHGGRLPSADLSKELRVNVRTDLWGYTPVEMEEILKIVNQLKTK